MIAVNSTVVGAEELAAKLKDLCQKDAKRAIRKGSRAGAKIVQAEAIKQTPKLTGTTASNIKVRSMRRSRRFVGTTVVENSPHAGFTEFGTKHSKGTHAIKTAYEAVKDQAIDVFLNTVAEEINKAGK